MYFPKCWIWGFLRGPAKEMLILAVALSECETLSLNLWERMSVQIFGFKKRKVSKFFILRKKKHWGLCRSLNIFRTVKCTSYDNLILLNGSDKKCIENFDGQWSQGEEEERSSRKRLIWMLDRYIVRDVDRTGPRSCPMVVFDISAVEPSASTAWELVH